MTNLHMEVEFRNESGYARLTNAALDIGADEGQMPKLSALSF